MRFGQALGTDVGVNLGGGDVGVTEHFLDGAEIGAVIHEVGSEAVAEHVGRYVFADIGLAGGVFHQLPNAGAAHGATALGEEQIGIVLWPLFANCQPALDAFEGPRTQWDQPFF